MVQVHHTLENEVSLLSWGAVNLSFLSITQLWCKEKKDKNLGIMNIIGQN